VGSAGLARHLARAWASEEPKALRPSAGSSVAKGTIASRITIVIVTSLQDVARRQAAAVAATGAIHFQPAPEDLIDEGAWERWSGKLLESVGAMGKTVLLTAPPARRTDLPAELITERFATLTARIVRKTGVDNSGVVVTGGDGARAVARALGATGFQIFGEAAAGVPVGALVGGPASGLRFVTKAGGFGEDGTLVQAIAQLKLRPIEND
jgi:D-threonate/D-erythronate kinase